MSKDTMREYITSELEEEQALGYTSQSQQHRGEAYPGDGGVYVAEDDAGILAEHVSLGTEDYGAYLARPDNGSQLPAVLVIHENKGLVPYIENVARRLAREGYVAVAPDLLSRKGGTGAFSDPAEATAALGTLEAPQLVADLRSVVSAVTELDYVDPDRFGIIGFCYGGGIAWRLITQDPRLKAAVPFYGPNPPLEDVPSISAAVLGIYGELDERISSKRPEIKTAMAENGKTFESVLVANGQHAFHNDTNPDRYNAAAAAEAWDMATEWLNRWLRNQ